MSFHWKLAVALSRRAVRDTVHAALDLVCPPTCAACGEDSPWTLCAACRFRLEARPAPLCPRCGESIAVRGARCGADHTAIRGLAVVRAPFRYRGSAGDVVCRAKFQADRGSLLLLGRAMADAMREWSRREGRRALVVAVPLHPRKRRRRGLDQAAQLAELVARRLGLGLAPAALARTRDTLPQGDVRVMSRTKNVADAFAVRRPRSIRGRVVLLVDDVRTSGSTARECARVLLDAGAEKIALVTAAQA